VGENRDTTVINRNWEFVVKTTSDWVNISGFTIMNGSTGIDIDSQYNNISSNNISNNLIGIYIRYYDDNYIFDNIMYSNSMYGIYLHWSSGNTIINNTMIYNGIVVYGPSIEHFKTHTIDTSNTVNSKPVIYWKNKDGGTVPSEVGQVILANCSNITIENHEFVDSDVCIILGYSSNNIITNNNASNVYDGIRLYYSDNNSIKNNNFSPNNWRGIYIANSNQNEILENIASNSAAGIVLDRFCSGIKIIGNIVYSNSNKGIVILGPETRDITIINNSIINNMYGVYLSSTSENIIYHNNIIDNVNQAYDDDVNYWDIGYPSGGNFWSDYTGIDLNSTPAQNVPPPDGIGDTNYSIDSDSVDKYPLMKPIGNFTFLNEGWNLISIPFTQPDTNLDSVLSSINGSYDAVQFYDILDQDDPWDHHHVSKPSHLIDLTDIEYRMGFWIHITEPGGVLFEYPGTTPSSNQSIPLHPGCNMVGYPSLSNHNRTMGLDNLEFGLDIDAIQWYDAATKTWHFMGPDDHFSPGRGYWVHSKVEAGWEVLL
jgi:parallel beta-helix repeat protein